MYVFVDCPHLVALPEEVMEPSGDKARLEVLKVYSPTHFLLIPGFLCVAEM